MDTERRQELEAVKASLELIGQPASLPPGVSVEYRVRNDGIRVLLRGHNRPAKIMLPAREGEVR